MFTPMNMDKDAGALKKRGFAQDVLNNDLFPHCHNMTQKIYFLGYMVNRLIKSSLDISKQDDRDSYVNKRVDLTGALLNNLFRNYFNKLVKDMSKQIVKEINTYLKIVGQTIIFGYKKTYFTTKPIAIRLKESNWKSIKIQKSNHNADTRHP